MLGVLKRQGKDNDRKQTHRDHHVKTEAEIKVTSLQAKKDQCSVAQLCPILCNAMECSPPSSSVHKISQARILEWVAIFSFRGSIWTRDLNHVSNASCIGRQVLYQQHHPGRPERGITMFKSSWVTLQRASLENPYCKRYLSRVVTQSEGSGVKLPAFPPFPAYDARKSCKHFWASVFLIYRIWIIILGLPCLSVVKTLPSFFFSFIYIS